MKRLGLLFVALALLTLPPAFAARPGTPPSGTDAPAPAATANAAEPSPAEMRARIESISARLHPQTGDVRLPTANVVLHLGRDYYFLPAEEARLVLTEGWGNPPEAVSGVLGIVFPAGRTFADDTWGAVITWNPSGYVSDDDAESADYDELLTQLRAGEEIANQRYAAQGYPAQHLVGWAQQPAYDRNTHSVVWARNIQIAGSPENTLNYDVRLLGRSGVLSLNMVTVMSQLAETRTAAQRFAAQAEFQAGSRYADYQPGADRVAEYGVAGLVAAGLGTAAVKKAGLLVLILAFLKKAGIFIVAGIAFLWGSIRRFFGRRDEDEDQNHYYEAEPAAAETAPAAPADQAPDAGTPPERSG